MKLIFKNKIVTRGVINVFFIIYLIMIFLRKQHFLTTTIINIGDGDFFLRNFKFYLINGHYNTVVQGTSVVYNTFLKIIYHFNGNVNSTFLILNSFSQILIGVVGGLIIKKWYKEKIYALSFFMIYFSLIWINNDEFSDSRNDLVLSTFFITIFYLIHKIINNPKLRLFLFIPLGFLYALTLGTREFSLLFIPPYLMFIIYLGFNFKLKKIILSQLLFSVSFFLLTIIIHYPSLKENNSLSFFDKNEDQKINWMHLNTIATKKMFKTKKIQIIRKDIYWEMVNRDKYYSFMQENNIKEIELPNTIFEYIQYDFLNYIKLIILNLVNTIVYFMRHFGFLFLLPFLYLFKEVKSKGVKVFKSKNNLFFLMFLAFYCSLLLNLNAVIEFRWFNSFILLFFVSIIISLDSCFKEKPIFAKGIFLSSLLLLILLNSRTIINML